MSKPAICVIGMGYIGLPTAIIFANKNFKVSGCDVNQRIVDAVNNKAPLIAEPELNERLAKAVDSGNLKAYNAPVPSDIYIIAVPTPVHHETKAPDLCYVISATKSILPILKKGDLVVLESTVPPGTTDTIIRNMIVQAGFVAGDEVDIAHAPEKAIPGKLFYELEHNDRIVGGIDEQSTIRVANLYRFMTEGMVMTTDSTSAEMVKLVENTYRDVNIALANEFALLAEKLGLDIWEIIECANHHPRVNVHQPGPGVGGHCIAVDPWFLVDAAPETMRLVNMARTINDAMPAHVVDTIIQLTAHIKERPKVAVLGLTFKANIDDVRESPSVTVCKILEERGVKYAAYDPWVKRNLVRGQTQSIEEAIAGADVLVLLVGHERFKEIDPASLGPLMRHRILYDTKNCADRDSFALAGFNIHVLGGRSSDSIETADSPICDSAGIPSHVAGHCGK